VFSIPVFRRTISISLIWDLSWEAKSAVEERVDMSRVMVLMMFFPAVEVWDSMVALAASAFAGVRAVMIT